MKKINKQAIAVVIILVLAAFMYWFVKPKYTFDSSWYISFLDYFLGIKPLNEFGTDRGSVFPLILWISYMIKPGVIGLEIIFCLFYVLFVFYVLKTFILLKLKIFHSDITFFNLIFVSLLIVFNPIIWGYFHVILTECISISLLAVYIYYSLKILFLRLEGIVLKKHYLWYGVLSSVFTVFYWHLKQSFFVNTIFILFLFEIVFILYEPKWKKVFYTIAIMGVIMVSLKASMMIWDSIICESKSSEDSNFLIYGMCQLRYFYPENEEGENGNIISVKDDMYNEIDTFQYKFEPTIPNRIGYLWECLKRYPDRFFQGYIDNYMLMSDLYRKNEFYENSYQYGIVIREDVLGTILGASGKNICCENRLIVLNSLKNEMDYSNSIERHKELLASALNIHSDTIDQYAYVSKNNMISKIMSSGIWWNSTALLYAILLVSAPLVFIFCTVAFLKDRRKIISAIKSVLSLYAWLFVFMHVFLGQASIDRYALPSYFAMLIVFGILVFEIECFMKDRKVKRNNVYKKEEDTEIKREK